MSSSENMSTPPPTPSKGTAIAVEDLIESVQVEPKKPRKPRTKKRAAEPVPEPIVSNVPKHEEVVEPVVAEPPAKKKKTKQPAPVDAEGNPVPRIRSEKQKAAFLKCQEAKRKKLAEKKQEAISVA